MRKTALQFAEAVFFPDHESVAISFHTAVLAQQIARKIGPNLRSHAGMGTMRSATIAVGTDHRRAFSHDPELDRLFDRNLQPADQMLTLIDLRGATEATILDVAGLATNSECPHNAAGTSTQYRQSIGPIRTAR